MEQGTSVITVRILLRGILDAFEDRDWDRLLSLYHSEALLTSMASGEQPLTPAEAVAQFKQATADPFYGVDVATISDLDPTACLAVGRIRFRNPEGGLTDSERYWLYIFKDGLLWRGSVHRTRQATVAAYKLSQACPPRPSLGNAANVTHEIGFAACAGNALAMDDDLGDEVSGFAFSAERKRLHQLIDSM